MTALFIYWARVEKSLCGGGVPSSHPSLGLSVFFLSFFGHASSACRSPIPPLGCLFSFLSLHGAGCALSLCVRVRRPSLPGDDCSIYLFIPVENPCVVAACRPPIPPRDPALLPPLVWRVRFIYVIPRAATRWAAAAVPLLVARRAPPAKRASCAGSSVCGYDSETPEEIQNEALFRGSWACRAYGLGE